MISFGTNMFDEKDRKNSFQSPWRDSLDSFVRLTYDSNSSAGVLKRNRIRRPRGSKVLRVISIIRMASDRSYRAREAQTIMPQIWSWDLEYNAIIDKFVPYLFSERIWQCGVQVRSSVFCSFERRLRSFCSDNMKPAAYHQLFIT